jgi:hypothetical protein
MFREDLWIYLLTQLLNSLPSGNGGIMEKKEERIVQSEDSEPDYSKIPADFPRPEHHGAVSGFQAKLLLVQHGEKYFAPGCTPPELYRRWDTCEDLANQLAAKALESKKGKRAHMTAVEILDQYLPRLIKMRWTSEAEARFIIRRAAQMLGWPVPAAAQP